MSEKITATVTAPCGHPLDVAVNRQTGLRRSIHNFDPIQRTCLRCKRRYRLRLTVHPNVWPNAEWYSITEVLDVTGDSGQHWSMPLVTAERVDRFGNTVK